VHDPNPVDNSGSSSSEENKESSKSIEPDEENEENRNILSHDLLKTARLHIQEEFSGLKSIMEKMQVEMRQLRR
jgi:hypothetical protein